jgi:hypothetical protein
MIRDIREVVNEAVETLLNSTVVAMGSGIVPSNIGIYRRNYQLYAMRYVLGFELAEIKTCYGVTRKRITDSYGLIMKMDIRVRNAYTDHLRWLLRLDKGFELPRPIYQHIRSLKLKPALSTRLQRYAFCYILLHATCYTCCRNEEEQYMLRDLIRLIDSKK